MSAKRPYKHILKNLFHEQAEEIIPLLMPDFRVEKAFDVELPDLISTPIEGEPGAFEQGIAQLALPGAKVTGVYKTEWIEHSGQFERAYRVQVQNAETDTPTYLVIEVQTEPEDKMLPRRLVLNFMQVRKYAAEDVGQEDEYVPAEGGGTLIKTAYDIYPTALCPFPQAEPAPIRDEFNGRVMHEFFFDVVRLWEKDAREFLNTHVSATYYLLPAMQNADAALLGLAIEELAQRFQNDDAELGRHLTGLSLMLQGSETMPEEEKLAAQEDLNRFKHLIKDDPDDE